MDSVSSTITTRNGQITLVDGCHQLYFQVRHGAPGRIRTCAPASGDRKPSSTVVSLGSYQGVRRIICVLGGHQCRVVESTIDSTPHHDAALGRCDHGANGPVGLCC